MMALLLLVGQLSTPTLTCMEIDPAGNPVPRSRHRHDLFVKLTGRHPGMIVDHIVPLACGGCDIPSNMSWQTKDEAKAKDAWELNCLAWHDGTFLRALQKEEGK